MSRAAEMVSTKCMRIVSGNTENRLRLQESMQFLTRDLKGGISRKWEVVSISQMKTWTTDRSIASLRKAMEDVFESGPDTAVNLCGMPPQIGHTFIQWIKQLASSITQHPVSEEERGMILPVVGFNDFMNIKRLMDPPATIQACQYSEFQPLRA